MNPALIGLALFAAALHASWNAFLRSGADRLWSVTIMSIAGTVVAIPFLFIFPLPSATGFAYILISCALQIIYTVFLIAAYRYGDLGQIYPVIRGTVPLMVSLGGYLFSGIHLAWTQMAGVVLIAAGIMSLALGKSRAPTSSILLALFSGTLIATYATIDSIGVKHVETPGVYAAWVIFLYGVLQLCVYTVMRGRLRFEVRSAESWKAVAGGILALLSYAAIIGAYSLGPAGPVSAIRETSVVFAAVIGWIFLGERLTPRRVIACLIVAAGAITIGR
ncbi:EamA family transporter [Rhizobium oryzicola]|uniref:DMT family transporter n=1 Tax=Rhizobium oryzicola TaxID=1232668 RepID=A0ABT8T011_9HYPH|nr:DMT family transporter [Rhizobium oryzicola]MDO1583946.1 DMT family transporter [Rhizobium oryzicola]